MKFWKPEKGDWKRLGCIGREGGSLEAGDQWLPLGETWQVGTRGGRENYFLL